MSKWRVIKMNYEQLFKDLKKIKTDEFNTSLKEKGINLSPDLSDNLSFDECVFAMCCLFGIKGIHNVKIAINNSIPVNYEQNMLIPEDFRALIVDNENKEELQNVMRIYNRHRFGAIAICSLDRENTKKVHVSLFPEDYYEDLMKGLPALGTNRLIVRFINCSQTEIMIFLKIWEIKFKTRMMS